jgi:hypothetical protein
MTTIDTNHIATGQVATTAVATTAIENLRTLYEKARETERIAFEAHVTAIEFNLTASMPYQERTWNAAKTATLLLEQLLEQTARHLAPSIDTPSIEAPARASIENAPATPTTITLLSTSTRNAKPNRYSAFYEACKQKNLTADGAFRERRIRALNNYFNWNITSLRDCSDDMLGRAVNAVQKGAWYPGWFPRSQHPVSEHAVEEPLAAHR